MIEHLPPQEQAWLARFFSAPNELIWSSLLNGSAAPGDADLVRQWLRLLGARPASPLILPFVHGGAVTRWYATMQSPVGGNELGDEINAWLGPTWLRSFGRVTESSSDPMAIALRDRFGSTVYRFSGADTAAMQAISTRLSEFARVLERRPLAARTRIRPVGAIRRDFERALLIGDEDQAQAMIAELKQTGRLNEENLRYLEVRLSAGLGLWPQIARDHWLIRTLADLALPPQILADVIEALYRTYVEEAEVAGNGAAMRDAFAQHIAKTYPKLFASRRGIRAPRVVKAFLLFEQFQPKPDISIIQALFSLLPTETDTSLFEVPPASNQMGLPSATLDQADEAFDDGQFDRAFEFYRRLPANRKTISRLVSCVGAIGTGEARNGLLAVVDSAAPEIVENLPPAILTTILSIRETKANGASKLPVSEAEGNGVNPWLRWADQLQAGQDLASAARDAQSSPTNWDASVIRESGQLAQKFADIIGSLNGDAGAVARDAVPQIYASFFHDDVKPPPSARPIASLLFLLIVMDETLSRTDLDLLAQLTSLQIELGVTSDDYVSLMRDLEDVQERIGSYAYLPWSLDVSELLATLPCPSDAARDARLRLFLRVLGQASSFAHRMVPADLLPIEMLSKDYGLGPEVVGALKREEVSDEAIASAFSANMEGKTIGIYTLAKAAGHRAKTALEELFPGCQVVVNSDLVATAQLTSLAKGADLFVFAWKSSSHQAFYCVKNAMGGKEPIWAPGKGTASILRAVLERIA